MKRIDVIGKKVGMLTVISEAERRSDNLRRIVCLCDCGNEKEIYLLNLRGKISCGCYGKGIVDGRAHYTHRLSTTQEYKIWIVMRARCINDKNWQYKDYGGRGITVCDRWINSVENFISDMGLRPTKQHSIDRIDVNGNYEPSNCRWATPKEQSLNRRNNVFFTFNGLKRCVTDWARDLYTDRRTLRDRIKRNNGDFDAVINKYYKYDLQTI